MSKSITAHGHTYTTVAGALARVAELAVLNHTYGVSDGRVTESNAIIEALAAAVTEGDENSEENFSLLRLASANTFLMGFEGTEIQSLATEVGIAQSHASWARNR